MWRLGVRFSFYYDCTIVVVIAHSPRNDNQMISIHCLYHFQKNKISPLPMYKCVLSRLYFSLYLIYIN